MLPVKNIIFDFGAVLYDIDFTRAAKAFEDIGISNFNQQYTRSQVSPIFNLLEKGKITPADFLKEIQQQSNKTVGLQEVEDAWNAILIGYRIESIQWLIQHQSAYRIFLLSNTNLIHYQCFSKEFESIFPNLTLEKIFEKTFFSFEIGMRKPDAEIFNHVLHEANLLPEETLFIDDTLVHIETAKSLGILCHHLLDHERIETLGKI